MADKLNLDDSEESSQSQQNASYQELVFSDDGLTDYQRVIHLGSERLTIERLCEVGRKFKTDKTAM